MKTTNRLIVMMLFTCGTQLVSSERSTCPKTVARGLTRAGKITWRGFRAVMNSGIEFQELHREIEKRHERNGYKGISEVKIPLIRQG